MYCHRYNNHPSINFLNPLLPYRVTGELVPVSGVPGENPHMHAENMQTPCRKTPRLGVKTRTFSLQGNSATNCAIMQLDTITTIFIYLTILSKLHNVLITCSPSKQLLWNHLVLSLDL
ncbi:hypothetical protein ILYODFUR_030793 [Ilyodon furcidens]|uniref:Uncharacterized protein n=1 Tax=Ilyodon furcidens TaxID=33524 RepID=A0ABV0SU46_9TELE